MLTQININPLFELGLNGEGIRIAVIDAGFRFLDQCSSFSHVFNEGRLIATKNFVNNSSVFETHYHGANVTSIIGGMLEDYHGLAPGAEYVLVQSENGSSEFLLEEYNWVAAAEYADSIGADIINSSLGYSQFDWPEQNHDISDMDGNTTIISRAAGVAFQKGMLVVTSAGNEGASSWQYITAPADQPLAMTVGSVDSEGNLSDFSGIGLPSNQYKPNLVACGEGASYVFNSEIYQGNGTSYSSPIIAGAAATLWQSFPEKTNQEIFDAIIQSCSSYPSGDNYTGYGIPDFAKAFLSLNGSQIVPESLTSKEVLNSYSDADHNLHLYIYTPENECCEIFIYDLQQQLIHHQKTTLAGMSTNHIIISDLGASTSAQLLLVKIQLPGFDKTVKVFMF